MPDPDDDWTASTEGSLDPDLTEEAGYAWWDPPDRRRWRWVMRAMLLITLLAVLGSALIVLVPYV